MIQPKTLWALVCEDGTVYLEGGAEAAVSNDRSHVEQLEESIAQSGVQSCDCEEHQVAKYEYVPPKPIKNKPDTPEDIVASLTVGGPKKAASEMAKDLKDSVEMSPEEMAKELGIPPEEVT